MRDDIIIRPETPKDYKDIISFVLRFFKKGYRLGILAVHVDIL